MQKVAINNKQIYGITYLKAILPLLVIACHERPFGTSASMIIPLQNVPDWKDMFYTNVLSLAVPLFFLISFYLYLKKRERIDYSPRKLMVSRVKYYAALFIGWRIVFAIFGIGRFWQEERGVVRNIYHLFLAGGDTLLYYLEHMVFYIMFLELIYTIFEKKNLNKKRYIAVGAVVSTMILIGVTFFAPDTLKIEGLRYFSPIGFVPLVFIAALIYELNGRTNLVAILGMSFLGILCACVEWVLLPDTLYLESGYSMAIPSYARLSILAISFSAFAIAFYVKRKPGKIIETMSSVSLYVYCIHQIVIMLIKGLSDLSVANYFTVTVITYALAIAFLKCKGFVMKGLAKK